MWSLERRHFSWLPVVLLGAAGLVSLRAATFTVTNTADAGPGSLRVAISNANFIVGSDVIAFAIPGSGPHTINLATILPSVLEPVTIDGTTQAGYSGKPLIALDGAAAGFGSGIYLLTSNSVVKGLAVSRFTRDGIRLEQFGGNVIQANFVGPGPFGTNNLGNGYDDAGVGGITVLSAHNLIGGTNAAERNVISGSNRHGIFLLTTFASENTIQGNYIGTDLTGAKRLGNFNNGIALATGARSNLIGGTNTGARNLISGNAQSGVYLLDSATTGNAIQGNYIGTDVSGALNLSNAADGVTISGAVSNQIGGASAGVRNVISGNAGRGVLIIGASSRSNSVAGNFIGTDVNGQAKLPNQLGGVEIFNASSNVIGSLTAAGRNVISGNQLSGVSLNDSNATANLVIGNFIGTDASGSNALGNSRSGVFISGVSSNTIGGVEAGARNVISGNGEHGLWLLDARARGNSIRGNYVGTDVNGNRRVGNANSGIRLETPANFIGGTNAAARNVISGNTNSGIYLYLASASNNVIQGNFIGTTATGTAALANDFAGLGLTNAPANLIGGTNTGAGNLISGNNLNGIYLLGRANGNMFQGNYLGTDLTGMSGIPNGAGLPLGDYGGAIDISGAAGNLIGGSVPGAGNLICANWRDAIAIGDAGATNTVIQGNRIGVKADGVTALGNDRHGIEIRLVGGAGNTTIGGADPAAGNIIANAAFAQYSGVRIRPHSSNTGILVRGNSIYLNGGGGATGLGIDIGAFGVNPNDNCDGDADANMQQNFPVLTNAQSAGTVTVVRGTLNSTANTSFLLQFYANPTPEPSGMVEGKVFLGDATVTTGAGCVGAFTAILTNAATAGQRITATATDPGNNTSEFSTNTLVTAAQLPDFGLQPMSQAAPFAGSVSFSASATGSVTLGYQWRFNGVNINGATGTSLTVSNLQLTNAGNYSVVASNVFGTAASTNALLTVLVSPPTLVADPTASGDLSLAWPTNGPAFRLLETTNLTPPVIWTDATNVPIRTNATFRVTLPPTGQPRFFRLVAP